MVGPVLVVEDNDDCRTITALFLRRLGYSIIESRDGVEAIEKAVSEHPRLILMDFKMPRMNGSEAASRLKEDPTTRDIPIVICTAFGPEGYKNTDLVKHAADIVQKPLKLEVLRVLVQKYLPMPATDTRRDSLAV